MGIVLSSYGQNCQGGFGMKEKTISQIEEACREFLSSLSEDIYATLTARFNRAVKKPILPEKRSQGFLTLGFKIGLQQEPEPDPRVLSAVLRFLKTSPDAMRHLGQELARKMKPHEGGRPRKLDTTERAKLCARIAELLPDCEDSRNAFLRAAAESRPPVSERTARRIYRDHLAARRSTDSKPKRANRSHCEKTRRTR